MGSSFIVAARFILGINCDPDDLPQGFIVTNLDPVTLIMRNNAIDIILLAGKTVLELFPVWVRVYSRTSC